MSAIRSRFCQLALSKLGATVLWNSDGPSLFDCSGLICWSLLGVGGRDLRATHRAQTMADETPDLATFDGEEPQPGDLCFYGRTPAEVIHVGIWLAGGRVLSADGATSRVRDIRAAKANPAARVRLHPGPQFRRDYLAVHRNSYLSAIEATR